MTIGENAIKIYKQFRETVFATDNGRDRLAQFEGAQVFNSTSYEAILKEPELYQEFVQLGNAAAALDSTKICSTCYHPAPTGHCLCDY